MALASKLLVLSLSLSALVAVAHAQTPASDTVQHVTELQFELARSLAQAGEHEAAAREFDRALTLQRQGAQATAEQTQAALQTLHAYVQSRPELPRMGEIGKRLNRVERHALVRPVLGPTAAIGSAPAPTSQATMVPNAPPSSGPPSDPSVALNPYRHPDSGHPDSAHVGGDAPPVPAPAPRSTANVPHRAVAPRIQLEVPRRGSASSGPWWEQMTLSAEELLIPREWTAALALRNGGLWPQLAMVWPELLIPPGWEQSSRGVAALLLVDAELLVPPGW